MQPIRDLGANIRTARYDTGSPLAMYFVRSALGIHSRVYVTPYSLDELRSLRLNDFLVVSILPTRGQLSRSRIFRTPYVSLRAFVQSLKNPTHSFLCRTSVIQATTRIRPSVSAASIEQFEEWHRHNGY